MPGGSTREYSYNPYGRITAERDELGHVTRYEYIDGLPLISRRINADGTQVNYRYDHVRLLLAEIENEIGEIYRFDYFTSTACSSRKSTSTADAPPMPTTSTASCWKPHAAPTAVKLRHPLPARPRRPVGQENPARWRHY